MPKKLKIVEAPAKRELLPFVLLPPPAPIVTG